jgi:ATP-dependent DNA helicase RecG
MEAAAKADAARPQLSAVAFAGAGSLDRREMLGAPLRSIPRPSQLARQLTSLRGAGPKLAAAAAELGIADLGDLLGHLPRAYRDQAEPVGLGELKLGEEGTVLVEVRSARKRPTRRRRLTIVEAEITDATGVAKAVWFNRAWLAERLRPGTRLLARGKLEKRGFTVAEHELLDSAPDGTAPAGLHTTGIVPMHPASERLRAQRLREWVWQALPLAPHATEPLPARLRSSLGLAGVADALVSAHFPRDAEEASEARRRLAFEELFLYQAALASRRQGRRQSGSAPALARPGELAGRWLRALPFELTADQAEAIEQIDRDLGAEVPMQRLLMGEVGSGKTAVAAYAMLRAFEAGCQAALMAPTETLAEQHLRTLRRLLGSEPVPLALLTSATPAPERKRILARLGEGAPGLVVGTHALIEQQVEFGALALAVVDEQHRFGVRQRAALDAKGPDGRVPHVLHMTATPIPRTLSLTAYGDLDTTTLRQLPRGRRPVRTWVVGEEKRGGAYEFLRERLREGRQAYVVCPLVSESEELEARAAEAEAERLAGEELGDFRLAALHGQMPSARKAEVMQRFAAGDLDVLVATSVIEVGIDVPNASVMVIESAERYGLSQLHQLRGRVGRGGHVSHCILFGDAGSETARARLEAIATESDGFKLAEIDLSLRGEGEVLGTRQHGLPGFRAAELPQDLALLLDARRTVLELLDRHGTLEHSALGPLMDEARRRFGDERAGRLAA